MAVTLESPLGSLAVVIGHAILGLKGCGWVLAMVWLERVRSAKMMLVDELPASTSGTDAVVVHPLTTVENLRVCGLQAIEHCWLYSY